MELYQNTVSAEEKDRIIEEFLSTENGPILWADWIMNADYFNPIPRMSLDEKRNQNNTDTRF